MSGPRDEPAASGGVFGRLPHSRPGSRSPLRDGQERARPAAPGAPARRASAAAAKLSRPPAPAERARSAPAREGAAARGARAEPGRSAPEGSIEDLAWAGVTVAAEAAALGVRFLNRALESIREAVERR